MRTSNTELAEFASGHGQALLDYAYLVCRDRTTAEDVVQAVFERLSAADFSRVQQPVAYVRRAISNEFISLHRRSRLFGRIAPQLFMADMGPDHSDGIAEQRLLSQAFKMLSARQRVAVVLRYYVDLDDGEIAHSLGCSESTVRSLISRALHQLRVQFEASAEGMS